MAFDPLAPSSKSVFDPLASTTKKVVSTVKTGSVAPYAAGYEPKTEQQKKNEELLAKSNAFYGTKLPTNQTISAPTVPFTPISTKQMIKDAGAARIAYQDQKSEAVRKEALQKYAPIATVDNTKKGALGEFTDALHQGVAQTGVSIGRGFEALSAGSKGAINTPWAGGITDFFQKQLVAHPEWQRPEEMFGKSLSENLTDPAYYARLVGEGLPTIGAAIVAGIATGGSAPGVIAVTSLLESGAAYEDGLAFGLDKKTAAEKAGIVGLVNGVLESITPLKLLSDTAAGKIIKDKIEKTVVNGVLRKIGEVGADAFIEGGTEMLQEIVSGAVAKTYDENRQIFNAGVLEAGIAGTLLGGFAGTVSESAQAFAGPRANVETKENIPTGIIPPTTPPEPPISRAILEKQPGQTQSLMDRMKSKERFQLGIDTKTAESLNIGDPTNPSIGSVFEVNNELFIVRDVDQTKGDVVGYKLPFDGSPTVSLETVNLASLKPVQTDIGTITSAIQNSQVSTDVSRSTQFVTQEKSIETVKKYFNDGDLTARFVERINTPDGSVAFGRYTPGMIELVRNPHKTTADHEAVHAYLDLFYEQDEKQNVYDAAREQMGKEDMADADVEEWVADRFAAFVQGRSGLTGAIKDFFDRVVSFLRRAFRRTNPDAVAKLFDDIRMKNRPVGGKVLNSVQKEYYQKPEELTAKIFTLPEVSDRTTIGRTHLSDLMKSSKANLKQAEFLLLQDVLNTQFKQTNDPLTEEARKYKSSEEFVKAQGELVYHGSTADLTEGIKPSITKGTRGENQLPGIYVTDSIDFARSFSRINGIQVSSPVEGVIKGNVLTVKNLPELKAKYGISDLEKLANTLKKEGYDAVKFTQDIGGARETVVLNPESFKTDSQLTEIWNQSQKPANDKIDVQAFKDAVHAQLLPLDTNVSSQGGGEGRYDNVVLPDEVRGDVEEYYENIYQSPIETSAGKIHFGGSDTDGEVSRYFAHTRLEDMDDGETRRVIELQSDLFQRGRLEQEGAQSREILADNETDRSSEIGQFILKEAKGRLAGVQKLEQYSQSWWQRIVREELRKAAVDGKSVLLFPTGETAMRVEGLGDISLWYTPEQASRANATPIKYGEIKVGQELFRNGQGAAGLEMEDGYWIVTEVLGDGKFKAVPKKEWDYYKNPDDFESGQREAGLEKVKETFDISGTIDKKNPIYKFYESDIGMYLNRLRKGNIEEYTDPQGVTWLKTAVTQEDLAPVIAYQKAEQIQEEDFQAYLESGAIPTPDSTLMAEESVAAYEIERELGYIPKPGEMPAGLAAQLDERRNDALVRMQELELQEQVEKEQAALLLEEGLVFMDSDMENSYEKFKKNAKRNSWMLESSTDVGTLKTKLPKVNVNTEYFPSVEGMSDNEMLEAYQSRYEIETELVEKIGKKTTIEIRAEAKRLAQKVVKDASIKKSERIKTTINRINARPKTTITMDESRLLQSRIRAMSEGAKSGAKFMKDEMIQKWRQSEADRLEIVNQLADYMSENLPPQQRGRFVRAIGKIKDLKNALELMDQIDRVQAGVEKRAAVSELKEQIVKFKKGGANIALDYANRVRDILSSFDATKPTEATMRRINAMAQYLDQNPDAFVTKEMISKLKRLTKTPLADMSVSEIKEVVDSVKELARLGKLKQDLKNMYDERVWEKNVTELVDSTVNRDPSEGTMKVANDAIIAASDEISAPARVFDAMDGDVNYQGPNVKLYRTIRNATQQAEIVGNEHAMDFLEGIKKAGFSSVTEEQQRVIYLHAVLEQGNDGSVGETMTKYEMDKLRDLTENEQKVLELAREILNRQTDDFATVYEEKRNKQFVRVENYIPFRYADANPMSAEDYVMDERMLKSSVEPGSTIQRTPSVKRELRTDFINIILQAIESQSNYIYVEPVMMNAASLVKSKEYREASGMHNSHYWNEYLDMVARNGASANALKMRFMDSFIRGARFNVTAAILGGRLTTIVLQPFNLFHSYGVLAQKYGVKTANLLFAETGKSFLNGSYYKKVTAQSPALTLREGGDATVREMLGIVDASSTDNKYIQARNKLIEWSLKAMQDADLRTASATNETFYKIMRAQGMSEEQARSESDFATDLITSSSQIADRPMIFSRGEAARTFSMFMSFALNEWGIISHDVVKTGLIKGDYKAKYRAGFALSAIFASKMLEQVGRNALSNLFKKEEDDKELPSAFAMSMISIVSAFPFLGPAVASAMKGFDPEIVGNPILATAQDAISGGNSAITGKTEATRQKGALRFAKSISTLTGVPVFPLLLDWIKNTMIE